MSDNADRDHRLTKKFVVSCIDREGIAELIEDATGVEIDPLDDRLTDEVCQAFANKLYEIEAKASDCLSYINVEDTLVREHCEEVLNETFEIEVTDE